MARGIANRANKGKRTFELGPSKSRIWDRERGANAAGQPIITYSCGSLINVVTLPRVRGFYS